LLEAMPRVLGHHPRARLLIAGHPAEPFTRFQGLIDRLALGDRVVKHLGYIPENKVAHYFGAADVVALPYAEGDFSGVLMSAYTFGRPVVATNVGGLRELVETHGTGHIVPPLDVGAFARAIASVLSDPASAAQMGERARQVALTEHSWSVSAHMMLRIYRGEGTPCPPVADDGDPVAEGRPTDSPPHE
jgi:D-inositol-3-phosphate glycosyltransferase